MEQLTPTPRTKIRRVPKRGSYDRATVEAILDDGMISHLAFVHEGHPFCIPTMHARADDTIYVHGSAASRMLRTLEAGAPVFLPGTPAHGGVLPRPPVPHPPNYRSLVVLGPMRVLPLPHEKKTAVHPFT